MTAHLAAYVSFRDTVTVHLPGFDPIKLKFARSEPNGTWGDTQVHILRELREVRIQITNEAGQTSTWVPFENLESYVLQE